MIYYYRQSDGSYITVKAKGLEGAAVYDSVDGAEEWYQPPRPLDVEPPEAPASLEDFFS